MYRDGNVGVNPKYFKEVIRSILKHNKVNFKFEKKDGSLRESYGTCNVIEATIKNKEAKPKGTGAAEADHIIKYYDLEKEAWRSFRIEKLRTIESIEPIDAVYVHSAIQRINEINARLVEIEKERNRLKNKKTTLRNNINNTSPDEFFNNIDKIESRRDELSEEVTALKIELKDLEVDWYGTIYRILD